MNSALLFRPCGQLDMQVQQVPRAWAIWIPRCATACSLVVGAGLLGVNIYIGTSPTVRSAPCVGVEVFLTFYSIAVVCLILHLALDQTLPRQNAQNAHLLCISLTIGAYVAPALFISAGVAFFLRMPPAACIAAAWIRTYLITAIFGSWVVVLGVWARSVHSKRDLICPRGSMYAVRTN